MIQIINNMYFFISYIKSVDLKKGYIMRIVKDTKIFIYLLFIELVSVWIISFNKSIVKSKKYKLWVIIHIRILSSEIIYSEDLLLGIEPNNKWGHLFTNLL